MKRIIFDIEADNFLDDVTVVHCIVLKNIDTKKVESYYGDSLDLGVKILQQADMIVGHNIIKYDVPVLEKLYNFNYTGEVFDTIVATRLLYPDIKDTDFQRKNFPTKLIGRHSLEAWGHRLGNYKSAFDEDFSQFTMSMLEYCVQDVEVTYTLYSTLKNKPHSAESMQLEHDVAQLIFKQERYGFTFDKEKAQRLYSQLNARRQKLEDELALMVKPTVVRTPFTPKVNNKTLGYQKGVTVYKEKVIEFNPSSRQHIAQHLMSSYNWKPKEFTADGKPKLDDSVLSKLNYPEAKLLAEHFLLDKRIGQLATGNQAWLKYAHNGRIHGICNTNSTVTARASHAHPNLAQVPSVSVPYGKQSRELFTVPVGKRLVGIDVSGLEVRMLAHYMARYDDGAYSKVVLEGDIHTETQNLAGLKSRDLAKRFYYCFLYGGGVKKIAEVINSTVKEAGQIKKRFLKNLPALNRLIADVQLAAEKGYLKGLDGRKVKVRSAHAALNTLLQSSGAIVCKRWLVEFDKLLTTVPSAHQVVWVHDEVQVECAEQDAETVGKLAVDAIVKTGNHYKLRLPLTGEYNVGGNWSETH